MLENKKYQYSACFYKDSTNGGVTQSIRFYLQLRKKSGTYQTLGFYSVNGLLSNKEKKWVCQKGEFVVPDQIEWFDTGVRYETASGVL